MNNQSILPRFDVFAPPTAANGMGAYATPARRPVAAQSGLGMSRMFALSPVVAAMKGLGAADATAPAGAGPGFYAEFSRAEAGAWLYILAIVAAAGALSYQAGKAMAPSGGDKSTWGLIGVPVGLFTGVIGLGFMGLVANQKKG
jgi:hypothetical protein